MTHPLCAKAHFNDGINSLLGEASFYRHLQPDLGVRTPQPHYTGIDPATNRGLIVMDDILTLGGRILDASEPYAVATCRDTLGQLALLHAKTWGDEQWDVDWLAPRVALMADIFPTDTLQGLLDDGRGPDLPAVLRDAPTLQAAMHQTARLPLTCVLHGDTHSGNAYLDAEGSAYWFDWQVVQRGHWSVDVAYHLGTVLSIEDRRAHEVELLEHYLAELAAHGVAAPSFAEAWDAYTLGFTWGYFLWTITRISSRAVVLLHIPRLGAALTDHDTFRGSASPDPPRSRRGDSASRGEPVDGARRLEVDEGSGVALGESEGHLGPLPVGRGGGQPEREPVGHRCPVAEPDRVEVRTLVVGKFEGSVVVSDEVRVVGLAIGNGDRALQEVTEIEAVVAPADDLPVEEPDGVIGQDVGVADVGVTVEQGRGPVRHRGDVAHPVAAVDLLPSEGSHRRWDASHRPVRCRCRPREPCCPMR